jgi:2-isopropylmalate synthase
MGSIKIYDTTLRDGTQAEDIAVTARDKVKIAKKLNEMRIDYIEGGWPGSNPKDMQFFNLIKKENLDFSKLTAFGSTKRAGLKIEDDPSIQSFIKSEAPVFTVFGKTWDFHVTEALKIPLEENLNLIGESILYLKKYCNEVIYDAEHFFDGFKKNQDYAIKTIIAAQEGGADWIVFCDTNGGTLPSEVISIIEKIKPYINVKMGIHTHNDSELAVANSLVAVEAGVTMVQGTINGFGERCGNANLCSIIPNLILKLNKNCLNGLESLKKITKLSRFVNEILNKRHFRHQPFVGISAFTHKGGVHVSAVRKAPETYEHINPELVGNKRRVVVSDLSGKSNIFAKAEELGLKIDEKSELAQEVLSKIKDLENKGFQFEGADASFEILAKKASGSYKKFFDLIGFRVIDEKLLENRKPFSEATIRIKVNDREEHTAALGDGPVNALDNALRKALKKIYPVIEKVKLSDYKVRILSTDLGTAALTRVLIESEDDKDKWITVGVSENIIEASWQALVDSLEYKLLKEENK